MQEGSGREVGECKPNAKGRECKPNERKGERVCKQTERKGESANRTKGGVSDEK